MNYLLLSLMGSICLLGVSAILPEKYWELFYKLF